MSQESLDGWYPHSEVTAQEATLLEMVQRTKKLFGFLRVHRRSLFDDGFQAELAGMYRESGAGKVPHPPAFLAMVILLQAYTGASDAEAVQNTVVDLRWQMVLDCLGATRAVFSQGALHDFRHRLIRHDLDRRLLERTAQLAVETRAFDRKKLPKTLRVAIDSKPLTGAGRVEDTINLLGHAARDLVRCAATLLDEDATIVAKEAGIPIALAASTKKGLDTDWTDPDKKMQALRRLVKQLNALLSFVKARLPADVAQPPLRDMIETAQQILDQNIEPDPDDPSGSRKRLHQGVARERRVSVKDADMRHGRKSTTKLFNGFKQHVAVDLDNRLILAVAVTPANVAETDALPGLRVDLDRYKRRVAELQIDRGYVASKLVDDVLASGGEVISKPRTMPKNHGLFTKRAFRFDLRSRTVTCPGDQTLPFIAGTPVEFDAQACARCPLRSACTRAKHGRVLKIANDEVLQQTFLRAVKSVAGRERLRQRIPVEHRLAHLAQKQGARARYLGRRNNLFDLRRHAALLNLEVTYRALLEAA
jgi:hypothetical protein